jgi:ATP-dependent DNA helicase RecG
MKVDKRRLPRNRTMTTATIGDGTSVVHAVWFNPYIKIEVGREVILSGKMERFRGKLQMKSPDMDRLDRAGDSLITGRVVPIHRSIGGLSPTMVRKAVANALVRAEPIHDVLPEEMVRGHGLVSRDTALHAIHFPEDMSDVDSARKRLVFDELFRLEIALALQKRKQEATAVGIAHDVDGDLVGRFIAALPFPLTGAQRRAIDELQRDLGAEPPMQRLLQGEVGSGKTVVAVACLLTGVQTGYQGAVMAPTEVLAEQHYLGFRDLLEEAGMAPPMEDPSSRDDMDSLFGDGPDEPPGPVVRTVLLTSNSAEASWLPPGSAPRKTVVDAIADGTADLVVGTHSLIQKDLEFSRIGVAVVDEQHRFGVYQRDMLRTKASEYDPDLLIMTATPIPRTVAMTVYGDLDVSALDEMPVGRTPVATSHVTWSGMDDVLDTIRSEVALGRQAFVVCPLVDESEKVDVSSATVEYERLSGVLGDLRIGLLHGRLRPTEKDEVMHAFRAHELDVLVATTVIEVGIDIPNATVMVIEDADRFGLSQLHQLRGRVGRGEHAAVCVLVAEPTTPEGEGRIAAMVGTNDGFELAELDLKIRGQGTVFGERQAGVKDLKLADILRDRAILVEARREAFDLVAADPDLSQHPEIGEEVHALLGSDVDWLFRS